MKPNQISDIHFVTVFFLKTYGKAMLVCEFVIVGLLQFDVLIGHAYGQAACLVVGMVLVKLAHLATFKGIGRAAQMEKASQQKYRAEDAHRQKIIGVLLRAAAALVWAQTSGVWSAIKAILAAELQVRSIVKSVLCAVTETLTPRLFPCPPIACA
jgi:hypothetical protein